MAEGQAVYKTEQSAKMMQGKKTKAGIETEIKPVDGGFVLEEIGAQSANGSTSTDSPGSSSTQKPKGRMSREEKLAEKRKKRKELGLRPVLDLAFPIDPGLVPYWELDNEKLGGRKLQARLRKGWEFVDAKNPSETTGDVGRVSQMGSVVTRQAGNGGTLFLMVIEKELYDEDVMAYNAKLDETEKQLKAQANNPEVPNTGLQMTASTPEVRPDG